MNAAAKKPKPAQLAHQRALAAAIERIEAEAEAEGRGLTPSKIEELEALRAAVAMLTRDINRATGARPAAAADGHYRGHELARGPPTEDRVLRAPDVCRLLGVSKATLWRLVRDHGFPKSFGLTSRAVGWDSREVRRWLEARLAARENRTPLPSPQRPRKAVGATETQQQQR
jgi:prophage regulatory protein